MLLLLTMVGLMVGVVRLIINNTRRACMIKDQSARGQGGGLCLPLPPSSLASCPPALPGNESAEEEGGKSGKTSLLEIALSITNVGRPACWELPSALRGMCSVLCIAVKPNTHTHTY